MTKLPTGISSLYQSIDRRFVQLDGGKRKRKRKLGKAKKKALRAREERLALIRARRYLEETLVRRRQIDAMIAAGRTQDEEGKSLSVLLNNLTSREIDLRAAIVRHTKSRSRAANPQAE